MAVAVPGLSTQPSWHVSQPSSLGPRSVDSISVMNSVSVSLSPTPCPQVPTGDPIPALPSFTHAVEPSFTWGSLDGPSCVSAITECYSAAVHWKPNLFRVPSGKVGDAFVSELSRLFNSYGSSYSALESIALTAAMLLPLLLQQRPCKGAKRKELINHQDRRLTLKDGAFFDLLNEGDSQRTHLRKSNPPLLGILTKDRNKLFAHDKWQCQICPTYSI